MTHEFSRLNKIVTQQNTVSFLPTSATNLGECPHPPLHGSIWTWLAQIRLTITALNYRFGCWL